MDGTTVPTVLVIEDDPVFQDLYKEALEQVGLTVLQASDGMQALDMIEEHPEIKVMIVDIMLPKTSGYEVISSIRNNALTKDIPVMAVSALSSLSDQEHSKMLGANMYVTKGEIPLDEIARQAKRYADT